MAKGTFVIVGNGLFIINESAYGANVAFSGRLCFLFRLDVRVIVSVGHTLSVGDYLSLGCVTDKEKVRAEIDGVGNGEGNIGVDISGKDGESVFASFRGTVCEFVNVSSASEAERLKYGEGSFNREAERVHFTGFYDRLCGIVRLAYGNRYFVVRYLSDSVYYASVVTSAITCRKDEKTVA